MITPDLAKTITSFDGTQIHYQTFGEGPPLIFGNGIGVGYQGLKLQLEHLRRRYRVVCWDQRGTFASGPPKTGDVSVAANARDCLAVMDDLDLASAGYIGWSMGVQVGFELLRHAPLRVSRMACIGGVAGRPFASALPLPLLHRVLPGAVHSAAPLAARLSPVTRRMIGSSSFFRVARALGYVSSDIDRDIFLAMARAVADHDAAHYVRMLAELGRHDASDIVARTSTPLLFVAGEKDALTPKRVLERLARQARNARVHLVPGGSHFALIEAPHLVNRALDEFFVAP